MTDITAVPEAPLSPPGVAARRWLPRVRAAWLVMVGLLFITFLISIPGTYHLLRTVCDPAVQTCGEWSQPTPQTLRLLDHYGISLQAAVIYHLVIYTLASLIFWGAGLLVLRHRSYDWYALLVSYLLIALGAGGVSFIFLSGLSYSGLPVLAAAVSELTIFPMYLALSLFLLTFPDGRIYPRRARWLPLMILANYAVWLAPGRWNIESWPPFLAGLWIVLVFGSHIAVQVYRYRHSYTPEQRQQTKWLIYGFGVVLAVGLFASAVGGGLFDGLLEGTFVVLLYLPIGLALTVAILRYRLWEIDIIINRTLVYTLLTALVAGLYVLIVGALSAFFKSSSDNLAISLSATGVVAVSFQPLRSYLQHGVDHVVFGERSNPYEVISRLSARLEANVSPGTLLPGIAETVAQTLKLPYVSIAIKDGAGAFRADATFGQPSDRGRITTLPLNYGQETVGQMVIGQAAGDKPLAGIERQLLDNIARQTGIAVHAVLLTKELQQSRLGIITAREEERRRLRRDLHDGLGPSLASHTLKIGAARALIESSPATAAQILADLENSLAASLADIRRLVYNLRPPALDQLGLASALRDFVEQYDRTDLDRGRVFTITVAEPLPALPAAVEVAAYRIAQEAVTNVIRHAGARHCEIVIAVNGALDIRVIDDGRGLPERVRYGVGLTSMQERASELGGEFAVGPSATGGTDLHVRIPLP